MITKVNLLHLENVSIFEQLQIEEALLRADIRNFCLLNSGSRPSIVLGLSNKLEEHVNTKKSLGIPIIKRFSGGGSVVVDENTLFVSFIFNKKDLDVESYPKQIIAWTEKFYKSALKIDGFSAIENDYVIGKKKCGGNAQSIIKDRWIHHSSLLWDFCPNKMKYLSHPPKEPKYRDGRSHEEFLYRLNDQFDSKEIIKDKIIVELKKRFELKKIPKDETIEIRREPHRKTTTKKDPLKRS